MSKKNHTEFSTYIIIGISEKQPTSIPRTEVQEK